MTPSADTARVVMSTGNHCVVETDQGDLRRCQLPSRRHARPVCGDRVQWDDTDGTPTVRRVLQRDNVIERGDFRGHPRPLAANIHRMVLVMAPAPTPDTLLADRYHVLAAAIEVPLTVWINKADFGEGLATPAVQRLLCEHCPGDTRSLAGSATTGEGIDDLEALIQGETIILVGQSGVGKSSLTQRLIPSLDLRINTLSALSGQGRHTTTTTRLFTHNHQFAVIDSPGVRTLRLDHLNVSDVNRGFSEIAAAARNCRFRDCHHRTEPGCAVGEALEAGAIHAQRLDNWRQLMREAGGFQ